MCFLGCVVASTWYYADRFLPAAVARPTDAITPLFNVTTMLTGLAFFLTQALLFFFAFRFRTRQYSQAKYTTGNLKLELVWTLIPATTFIALFAWGQALWTKLTQEPDNTLEIEVVAEQFVWRMRYPGEDGELGRAGFTWISNDNPLGMDFSDPHTRDDFVPLQMHIPKNRPIKVLLRSKDVIHDFYIPHFHTKMDAVPGLTTALHFEATTSTTEMREKLQDPDFNYEVACAELCGRMHFAMKFILVVDEPATFDEWYHNQQSWMAANAVDVNL